MPFLNIYSEEFINNPVIDLNSSNRRAVIQVSRFLFRHY